MPEGGPARAVARLGGIVPEGAHHPVRPRGDALDRDVAALCERRGQTSIITWGRSLALYPANATDFGAGLVRALLEQED